MVGQTPEQHGWLGVAQQAKGKGQRMWDKDGERGLGLRGVDLRGVPVLELADMSLWEGKLRGYELIGNTEMKMRTM